jgi:uncharacterized protein YndB with AHSA1/START domain
MSQSDSNKLVIRRRVPATREELFSAWTDAEGMREWMCPGNILSVDVHMDLRVGGSFLIVMRDAHDTHEHRGEFTIIDRPGKLSFTWIAKATDFQPTLVTVELFAVTENETELVLTHENFPGKEATDQYRGGWGQIVDRLETYLHARR